MVMLLRHRCLFHYPLSTKPKIKNQLIFFLMFIFPRTHFIFRKIQYIFCPLKYKEISKNHTSHAAAKTLSSERFHIMRNLEGKNTVGAKIPICSENNAAFTTVNRELHKINSQALRASPRSHCQWAAQIRELQAKGWLHFYGLLSICDDGKLFKRSQFFYFVIFHYDYIIKLGSNSSNNFICIFSKVTNNLKT